jgi:hypothetical protein
MQPAPEWRKVLRKAWSVRFMLLASVLTGCEAVISVAGADWMPLPQWLRLTVIMAVIGGAFAARLVAQKDFE